MLTTRTGAATKKETITTILKLQKTHLGRFTLMEYAETLTILQ